MRLIYLGENTFLFFFEFIFDHILIWIITFIILFTKYKMSLQPSFMIRLLNAHCKWNLYFNRILILKNLQNVPIILNTWNINIITKISLWVNLSNVK